MHSLQPDDPITELVIEVPESIPVFEKYGIDYCCGGKSLGYACRCRGHDVNKIIEEIRSTLKESI
ncbi:MAG TPA: hypothetical protein EYO33_00575 [Phycisphaerales bacterium]|nr:hypothetical protein [Phycisphaerales bacterium]